MKANRYPHMTVRLLYSLILLTAAAVVIVVAFNGEITQKDVATSTLALLGTFLGATFAFRLNEDKEAKRLHATQRQALNRAMFILARQHNAIHQLQLAICRYSTQIERAINLPALKPPPYADLNHNFTDL